MKWCTTAAASLSLAGLALGSNAEKPAAAEVYTLAPRSKSGGAGAASDAVPHLPHQLARHVLLQRTMQGDDHSSLSADLPSSLDQDRALAYLNEFGREPLGLFGRHGRRPSLVVMLEGVTAENVDGLKTGLENRGQQLAFKIEEPPSAAANTQLLDRDFLGVASKCNGRADVDAVVRPGDKTCWEGQSLFAKYDVAKQPSVLSSLVSHLDSLVAAVTKDEMEVMILLMPESSRTAGPKEWTSQQSAAPSDLRRRDPTPQSETVITDGTDRQSKKQQQSTPVSLHASSPPLKLAVAAQRRIPACFASLAACTNATNGCSGHGLCLNRYTGSNETAAPGKAVCFECHCLPTEDEGGRSRTFWAGRTCQKKDVSTQFWLITGLTIALIGMVSLSVGMLFSVGEEKLPGVIGAGVSRPTK